MGLRADIIHPSQLTDRDRAGWASLRASAPAFASPLLSPAFAEAVGRVRADAAVALLRQGDGLVGVLAHHRRGGLARPIGAPFSDYHALLTGPAPGFDASEALSVAGLSGLAYSGLVDPHGLFGAQETTAETHLVVVNDTPDAYLEERRARLPKHFKNWRRLEHKAEREVGPLRMSAAFDDAAFAQVIDWKRRQLKDTGRHDFLTPGAWTSRLMADVFAQRDGDARGLLLTLWAGDVLMCGHFGLREGAIFHPWLASMNPEMKAFSPGQAFLSRAVRAMPELGLTTLDLGPGHGHYKEPFASGSGRVAQGVTRAATARPALVDRLARLAPEGRVASIRRRLDHIAQVELSFGGRVRGVAYALAAKGRAATGDPA